MQQEIWGWLIVIYLFLGGLGAGAFIAATLAYKGYLGNLNEVFYKYGFVAAPVTVIVGTVLLVLDLATLNPFKILNLFTNPLSMMSLGTYLLTFFIIVSFLVYKSVKEGKKICDHMLILGTILAIGVMGYTGLLLYAVKAIPLWASLWLPILFSISALSTGLSLNSLAVINAGQMLTHKIHKLHTILLGCEIVAVIALFAMVFGQDAAMMSLEKILAGSLAFIFWFGFVILGIMLPFVGGVKHMLSTCDGINVCNENVSGSKLHEIGVLIGGFCLRVFIIFGAFYIF